MTDGDWDAEGYRRSRKTWRARLLALWRRVWRRR